MPLYSIQGPDGRIYEIEGPAGATREQVIAAIQAQLRQNRRSSPSIEELVDAEVAAAMAVGQGAPKDAGFIENIISGFGSGFVGTGEMAALGAASLLEEDSELAAREKIKSITDALRPEGGDPDDISYLVSSGLGSIVGTLTPAVAAAALPVSAPVAGGIGLLGAGAIGIGAGAGEASERARAADATEEERNLATLRGAGIGILEITPLGRILKIPGATKLAEKIGGKAVEEGGSRIRSALTTGGLEAAQEAAAGFLQNLNERGYNPEKELLDAGLIDEAIAGGGAGAIVQAVTDFFIRGKSKGRAATELDEEGRAATELGEDSTTLTDTELLQAINEEGLSETGVPSPPTKPLTDAETLQAIDEEGLLQYGDSRSRGKVQEDLLSILDTEAVEPSSLLVDTETTDTLADFSQDDIRNAVDTLTARGVEPSAVTEDAVRAELVETKAREAEALEGVDFADPVAFDQPDLFTSELREARAADPAEALRQDLSRRGELVPQRESITPDPIEPIAPVQEDLIGDLDDIELGDVEAAAVERTFEDLKRTKRDRKELRQESDLESIDARQEGDRQRATEDKRYGILQQVIETNPTRNYNTLRTAFERALKNDGITNAKASDRERETIRRAVNMQMAERASLRAPLPQDPAQESFPGLGKRSAQQAAANRPVVEEAPPTPAPQPVDAELLDRLGISPKARIRKRVEGKDLNDPDVRAAFSSFLGDRRAGRQAKLNVQRMLEGIPDAQMQLPGLFDPKRGPRDARSDRRSKSDTSGTSVSGDTQAVGQGGVSAGSTKTAEGTAEPETRPVGDTGVSARGSAGGKRGKPTTVEKKSAPGPKENTLTRNRREFSSKDTDILRNLRKRKGIYLEEESVAALDTPLDSAVTKALRGDSLRDALSLLGSTSTDKRLSKLASKLANVAGDTKVKVVKNLTNEAGKPVAGLFDPQTNTVSIDADAGMNPHVLLHETTHAATSATLANKSHPLTKQLTRLYEDVKDYLDTAYGAKDVDEFASEAMSNPEFQAKLARINPNGQEINALQRFFNSVGNFLRKLVGMQTKPVGSALSEADRLIEGILAPAPMYRDAYKLAMKSTRDGVKETIKEVDDTQKEVSSPPMNRKDRAEFVDGARDLFSRAGEGTKFILPKLLDAQSLADVASGISDGLGKTVNKFYEAADNMRGDIAKAHAKVYDQVQIVEKWRNSKNGKEKQILLDDVIYNKDYGATIYQVDPTKPITEYQGKNRFDKSGNDLEAVWKAQRTSWNKLGSDGQRIYKTMRNMYRSQFEQLKDVVNGRIDRLLENNPEAATQLKNEIFANMFQKKQLDVYFPLLREGRYKISYTYKDPKTGEESYVFQMLDSKRDRDRLADELRADPDVVKDKKSGEKVKIGDGDFNTNDFSNAPSTSFVGNVVEILNQNGKGLSDAEKEVYKDNIASIMRLFVNALPESSFAKSLQRRKNTPGYMTDSIYAMKSKGFSLASQIEKLKSTAIFQQIEADLAEVEKNPKLKPDRKGAPQNSDYLFKSIASDLKKRIRFAKYGADNKGFEQYVRFANQMAFVYTLGGNTASAAIQLAQLPMFVYPMLGADYGYQKAYDELTNASSLVLGAKMNVETIKESTGVKGKLGTAIKKLSIAHGIDAYYDVTANGDYVVKGDPRLPPERVKELERIAPLVKLMSERGHLNRSFIFDALSIQEAGSARTRGGLFQTASNMLDMITGISALMFNQSERFNRQVTAVAAYNLALDRITAENPKMPLRERQDKAAQSAVYDAQQYNGGSTLETAPSISQQSIGRVAMMYKTYGLKMYAVMLMTGKKLLDTFFAEKEATGSIPKATINALKSVAFKQLLGIHGSALFFSGIHGIPIYGAIQQIADWFLPDDEDDFDTIVRNHVNEGWYKGAVNQILTELGVGADIASRVRLTGLLLQENRYNDDPSPEEFMGFYLGGPALSIYKRVSRGIEDLGNGQFERGFENLMPASVANAYKGMVRYPREGGIVSRRTNMIYDDMTGGEMFAQIFGFAPSEYIRQQEETQRIKGIDKDINAQRSDLTKRLYVAARLGDWSEIATVNKEIQEFNREHPSFALSPKSIIKSLKQHMKTTETMYNGVSISPAMRRAAEDHLRGINNGFTAPVL